MGEASEYYSIYAEDYTEHKIMSAPINKALTVNNTSPATGTSKSHKVWFKDQDDEYADQILAYASIKDWQADDFTKGDEQQCSLEWVKTDNGGFYSVKKWGAKSAGEKKGFGGGGRSFTPKTAGEIATIPVCTLATASSTLVGTLVTMGVIQDQASALGALKNVHETLLELSLVGVAKIKESVQ